MESNRSTNGIGFFGSYDMLGNVREWCSNPYGDGRATRGCGWSDASYNFAAVVKASPFDRDPRNGFRCVRYLVQEEIPGAAFDPVAEAPAPRDFLSETPASDEVFQVLLDGFSYDHAPLDPRTERIDDTSRDWVLEKVSVAAAYDGERLPIFLYLPRNVRPPFQAVVFYPGSDVFAQKQEELTRFELDKMDFVVKSGRVVVVPVYKGAMERADAYSIWSRTLGTDEELASHRWTENLIKVVKDFRRTLDYLETRRDIDSSRIGFQGFSEGGIWAPMFLAAEGGRIRAGVVHLGGLYNARFQPQSDALNYVTRVRVPTLMLHGTYDPHLTLKDEAEPMFRLLGTPAEDKMLITYPTDHFLPKTEMIRDTLAWYDKYLGPVR